MALDLLAVGPMRVGELAEALGLVQSTTSRLMLTLERAGYVARTARSGAFELGPMVLKLGGSAANQNRVHRASRVLAQHLAHEYGVGVNVASRAGKQLQYLVSLQGGAQVVPVTLLGQFSPLHATALGKSLLLGVPERQREELVTPMTRYTAKTLTTFEALDEELAQAFLDGFTHEIEELALGRACFAAPVRDESGDIVAAVSVSGSVRAMDPTQRRGEWGAIVVEIADAISTNLGFLGQRGTVE